MKTYGNLWPRLCDFENLYYAWRDVRRGKSNKVQVLRFESDLEGNLCSLWDDLAGGTYQPLPYTNFYVYEKKRRKISAADLRDRVVHHAYCNVVEPIFERRFIHDSYACRIGKGTHRALDRCTHFARQYRYVLKCDVAKFQVSGEALAAGITAGVVDQKPAASAVPLTHFSNDANRSTLLRIRLAEPARQRVPRRMPGNQDNAVQVPGRPVFTGSPRVLECAHNLFQEGDWRRVTGRVPSTSSTVP